jgi:ATP-dependent DNA ligase
MSIFKPRQGVMLCQPATERRVKAIFQDEYALAQPKLNGERCRVQWFSDEPYLISSYGNEFQFTDRIKNAILTFHKLQGLDPIPYDGEIYVHGWPRERIDSALRRKKNYNPDVELLEFHIFDVQITESRQLSRFFILKELQEKGLFTGPIKLVQPEAIRLDNWMEKTVQYLQDGYEGIILRQPGNIYTNPWGAGVAQRPQYMLKFKPTEKDVYVIVGYKEGTGWAEGMLGAFVVQGLDNTRFSVGTGRELTKDKRIAYWKIRESLPGRHLLVKHEPVKTSGGVPLCTVAYELLP